MNERDRSRRTEAATPKRLRDLKRKGQISRSRDLVTTALIASVFVYFWFTWRMIWSQLEASVIQAIELIQAPFQDALPKLVELLISQFVDMLVPLAAIIIAVCLVSSLLQSGWIFSIEHIKPKFERISPVSGARRVWSVHNLFELIKSVLKILTVVSVTTIVLVKLLTTIIRIPYCDADCELIVIETAATAIAAFSLALIAMIALFDVYLQRRLFLREHKMTIEEVKRERREIHGDPRVTHKRREHHLEITKTAVRHTVERAAVVLVDHRGHSVVIQYDQKEMALPVVALLGRNQLSEQINELAKSMNIPVIVDLPLVDDLLRYGREGAYIPSECIEGVAMTLKSLTGFDRV